MLVSLVMLSCIYCLISDENEMDLLSIYGEEESFNFMIVIEIMPVRLRVYDPYRSVASSNKYLTIHPTAFMRHNAQLLTRSFNLIEFYKEITPLWVLNHLHHIFTHTERFLPAGPVVQISCISLCLLLPEGVKQKLTNHALDRIFNTLM